MCSKQSLSDHFTINLSVSIYLTSHTGSNESCLCARSIATTVASHVLKVYSLCNLFGGPSGL